MSTPIKSKEFEYTERCLIEAREKAKQLLVEIPEPHSEGWTVYVAQTLAAFKESGQ